METAELRIPVKPQLWMWWLNAIIQLPLGGAMVWLAFGAGNGSVESRVFLGALGLFCLALWCFGVSVLWRLRGAILHVVVGPTQLEIPSMVRRSTVVVPYAEIEKAKLQEIRANRVSFFQLYVGYRVDGKKKTTVIAQQLIGREALDEVCAALVARGVAV